jgi:hypothetical protein
LVGLEVEHRDHTEPQRDRLARVAQRLGLVHTGASDYHGAGKVNRLGENVTSDAALRQLRDARGN